MQKKKTRNFIGNLYLLFVVAVCVSSTTIVSAQPLTPSQPPAEKYKLIFPTGYDDNLLYNAPPKDKKEEKARTKARDKNYSLIRNAKRVGFLHELNKAGSQNYRLLSATVNKDIAMTVLGEKQNEYLQYETNGYSRFVNDRNSFDKWFSPLASQGYSLINFDYSGSLCEVNVEDDLRHDCKYRYRFILERQQSSTTPHQFKVLKGDGWLVINELRTDQIYQKMSNSLFPTHFFSGMEILLQTRTERDSDFTDKSRVLVATSTSTSAGILGIPKFTTLAQRVNSLSNEGYRIALAHEDIALMYRNSSDSKSVIYWWIDPHDADFEHRILRLQERGSIYRLRSLRTGVEESTLIFEQPTEPTAMQREYKILKLELEETENFAAKKVTIDLTPASKETMKKINQLAQEGYEVRELFIDNYSRNGCSVLLERKLPKP